MAAIVREAEFKRPDTLKVHSLSANEANVYAEHPAIRTRASTFVQALSRYTVNKYDNASEKVIASHPSGVDVIVL